MRWPVIIPVSIVRLILGSHPLVYYVTPVLNSFLQVVLLYYFVTQLSSRTIAFYSAALFTIWPYMWRSASQIRPAVFSMTYILLSLIFLFHYLKDEKIKFLSVFRGFPVSGLYEQNYKPLFSARDCVYSDGSVQTH